MDIVTKIVSELLNVWKEMFSLFMQILPKGLILVVWVASAFIVLPCVVVAQYIFPKWTEMMDDF